MEIEKKLSDHLKDFKNKMKPPPEFKDDYKILLQHIMVSRTVPFRQLEDLLRELSSDGPVNLDEALSVINKVLNNMGLKITTLECEISGQQMCSVISTTFPFPKENVKESGIFPLPIQVEYFFKIVEKMVLSDDGFTGSIEMLQLSNYLSSKINKATAEEYLNMFVATKYLTKLETGQYCLTPLAISELRVYLNLTYSAYLTLCKICNYPVFVHVICSACESKFHKYCFMNIYGVGDKCSSCKSKRKSK